MMRTVSEKLAIIRLVEESELSVRRTLSEIKVSRSSFYRYIDTFFDHEIPMQYLANIAAEQLAELGFTVQEVAALQGVEMRTIDDTTLDWMRSEASAADWVLKNQGEGGGHCLFDVDIQPPIARLAADEYPAWGLMRRLRPVGRSTPTLMVREGVGRRVDALVSELGMFSAHLDDEPLISGEGLPPG